MELELVFSLVVLVVGLAAGVPIGYVLIAASVAYYIGAPQPLSIVPQRLGSGLDSFTLAAVPFFMLAGTAISRGGIASRLLGFADGLVGHRRGGLAQVNVINSLIMGGMTGSGIADAAVDCKILVPVMERNGYSRDFSAALSVATGVIAPIMPPGIGLILYGLIGRVSVGRLFLGGIVPALLLTVAMSIVVSRISKRRGYGAQRSERLPTRQILARLREASWALFMPVLLIVGLRIGVFTPTELGAISAVYAIAVGVFVYRDIRPREILHVMRESVVSTASIMLILAAGTAFAGVIIVEGVPQAISTGLSAISHNQVIALLIVNIGLLILGMFFDGVTLLVVTTPILVPAMTALGIDPVHFGLVMVVNITIGSITPPLGLFLFTVSSITGASMSRISREALPFVGACVVVLFLITYIPQLVLFVPNLMMG